MADPKKRLPENITGDLFVDSTCENFGICKERAPELFTRLSNYHVVSKQAESDSEKRKAMHAVLSCPKGSIGTGDRRLLQEVFGDFPFLLEDDVYFCGFNSLKSAGANSYFIKHPQGNWLVSTPKFQAQLVSRFENMGGIKYIFLSHRDDLGEAERYSQKFNCETIVHELDKECRPSAEHLIRGDSPFLFLQDFLIIPTPGHTEGHCMLLFKSKFLFSGDSLKYDLEDNRIKLWDPHWTWYSYQVQACSLERLLAYEFSWVLASHGGQVKREPASLRAELKQAIEEARSGSEDEACDELRLRNLQYYAAELRKLAQPVYAEKIEKKAAQVQAELRNG